MKLSIILLSLLPALTTSLTLPERHDRTIPFNPTPNYAPLDLNKLTPKPSTASPSTAPKPEIKAEGKGPSNRPHHRFTLRPDPSIRTAPIRNLGPLTTSLGWFPTSNPPLPPFHASIPNNTNGTVHTSPADPHTLLYLRPSHSPFGEVPEYYVAQGDPDEDPVTGSTVWEKWTVGRTMETVDDGGWNVKEVERYWLGVGESYAGWLACEVERGDGWFLYWTDSVFTGEGCSKPFRMEVVWE